MRHFKLTIAYDGTDFHGWQMQANKPTIQGEIVSVLQQLTQEKIILHGAGRTDAGVHALGQVASFRTRSGLSAQEFQRALNALLPPTIRIVGAEEVGPDFNARWSARGKTYRYRLYRGKVVPPAIWRYVLHYPFPLDEDAMRDAAARFACTTLPRLPLPPVLKTTIKNAPLSAKSTRPSWRAPQTTKNWFLPFAAVRSCVTWYARWWAHCSTWAAANSHLRISSASMNSGTAPNPAPRFHRKAWSWLRSSMKRPGGWAGLSLVPVADWYIDWRLLS